MEFRLCLFALLFPALHCFAGKSNGDTLRLTIPESEELLLHNNLPLLAAHYNINANQAFARQAKLWDNPVINTDQNIYDGSGFFKHNQVNGQVYVQVMQLIKTAGKRNKLMKLAEDNTDISISQFDDLVRTLRYSLLSDLFEINDQLRIRQLYDAEIRELKLLVKGTDEELQLGNISVKDNIRIKALLFDLQNELINVDAQLITLQSEVKLLLHRSDSSFIVPVIRYSFPNLITAKLPSEKQLFQLADSSRPDLQVQQYELNVAHHNLSYQKALAKPDINIGTEYDQRSSYVPGYVGLAISLPLNVFNRNQGNISAAHFNLQQQQTFYEEQVAQVQNDVSTAIAKVKFYQEVNNLQQVDFAHQNDVVFQNMFKSYQQRQVSLLEFIDFADAYKETKLKIIEQQSGLIQAINSLNYATGKDVIHLN